MVPALDLMTLLQSGGAALAAEADKPFLSCRYLGPSTKGQKHRNGKPKKPTWWDLHCPDGVQVSMSNGMAIFLIGVGGLAAVWAFWDMITTYLDNRGWRKMDNTMWGDMMSLGVLGGMTGDAKKIGDDVKNWVGALGAKIQGK